MYCLSCLISKEKLSELSIKENNVWLSTDFPHIVENIDKTKYVFIETDYFGGVGEQFAKFNSKEYNSINQALKDFGVGNTSKSYDLFKHCGLHKFRSNEDLETEINKQL